MTIIDEDIATILDADVPWSALSGRTVLISGAGGFLPAYIVRTLIALNDRAILSAPIRVLALVRNITRARRRLGAFEGRPDFQWLEQDVTVSPKVDEAVDFVIHAASQASPKFYSTDPVGTLEANVLGTRALLAMSKQKRSSSFLFFSSSEVYGEVAPDQIPTREDQYGFLDPTLVRSCYGESKRMGETMCVSWAHQFGLDVKIVRPFHTYGPGMALDDGRIFSDFVANIVHRQNLKIKSDGKARRAFCYVADATVGFFKVLLEGASGGAYNIGNPAAELSIGELADTLVAEFSERDLAVSYEARSAGVGYTASTVSRNSPDIARAAALGWQPKTLVAEGFRRTVTSLEES